jgi:hypothetical protein
LLRPSCFHLSFHPLSLSYLTLVSNSFITLDLLNKLRITLKLWEFNFKHCDYFQAFKYASFPNLKYFFNFRWFTQAFYFLIISPSIMLLCHFIADNAKISWNLVNLSRIVWNFETDDISDVK